MKKVALVIGHGPRIDRGAVNAATGTTELDWNTELAGMIKNALAGRVEAVIVHRTTERLQPVLETNATGADCAIELHLNSFDCEASGTEMICLLSSPKAVALASRLQSAAVRCLQLPNRGVKGPQKGPDGKLRGHRWLKGTTMAAVIVESGFIDNNDDLEVLNMCKHSLAQAYADAIVSFLA